MHGRCMCVCVWGGGLQAQPLPRIPVWDPRPPHSRADPLRERTPESTVPSPAPVRGAPATHKLKDEEQVGEGDEDREATGQAAAARRRCGGHARVARSGSPLTARLLRGAQCPGRPRARVKSRGARGRGGRSPIRPPRPTPQGTWLGLRGCRPEARRAGVGACLPNPTPGCHLPRNKTKPLVEAPRTLCR